MKTFTLFLLTIFLSAAALAQSNGTVGGKVTDAAGRGIAGAQVTLASVSQPSQKVTAVTDAEGNYKFESVVAGGYAITVTANTTSAMGTSGENDSALRATENFRVAPGQQRSIDLTALPVLTAQVSIASGTARPIDEVSKTINVIDAQEMRDRADFSMVDSLATLPGFRIQQSGGFGRLATIKTRGLRNSDTAILIDGIRFRDAAAINGDASGFLSDFTLTSVAKIEVLRGSGSSLYGTNAIGGTIDFQTPKPPAGMHGSFSGAFGGLGLQRYRGNFSDGTKDGKFGFNLGVARTVYTRGIDGEDDAHNTNFQSRIEYNPFERTNISARFFVSDAYVRLNTSPDAIGILPATNTTIVEAVALSAGELKRYENGAPIASLAANGATFIPDANDPDAFGKSKFFTGQLALTQVLSDQLIFRASYQGLKSGRKNANGPLGVEAFPFTVTTENNGQIHTANTNLNWTPNRANEITVGYEYEREKYSSEGYSEFAFDSYATRVVQTSHTIYAQEVLSLLDRKLQLAGGARAQFFDLKQPIFTGINPPYAGLTLESPPNAYTFDGAASYFFDKTGTKVKMHVGNGYRVASLYERFGTFFSGFSGTFIAQGDPNLKPERSIAFDGGIEQNLFDNRVKLSGVYFYTQLRDIIRSRNSAPDIGPTPRPFGGYVNARGGVSRGAEFSVSAKPTRATDIFTSYTFTNSDQAEPQIGGTGIYDTLVVPKHMFTAVVTQRFKRAWASFDFVASSSYLGPIFQSNFPFNSYVFRFKGTRKADLTGGYEIPLRGEKMKLTLFGTIENLFDQEYYESGFRTPGINGRAGFRLGF